MKLYGGIDLHSNNSVVALLDEEDHVVYRKRLANEPVGVLGPLKPDRDAMRAWWWNPPAVAEARQRVGLSQMEFASLLGVPVRTLQD